MAFNVGIFDYLDKEQVIGRSVFDRLARDNQMASYRHQGFWMPMETIRDKTQLEEMWRDKSAPWKVWND